MGYQCPVCAVPQADATHLADHLGFTAVIHDDDEHGAWLDEHVEGWSSLSRAELREVVVEFAEEADYPQVFEDTVGGSEHADDEHSGELFADEDATGHGHDHPADRASPPQPAAEGSLSAEAQSAVEEARMLTERRRANRDETDERAGGDDDAATDGDGDSSTASSDSDGDGDIDADGGD